MPGLVAVIAAPGAPAVTPAEIERLAGDYEALRGTDAGRTTRSADRVRAVLFGPDGQPTAAVPQVPSWRLCAGVMHGSPTATSHTRALEEADGQFAVVSHDAATDEVVVATDPMGMHALYVAEQRDRLYVATSALVLARHVRCPASRLGVQSFLVSGYQFGTRTHWDAVRRLDPGTCLVVTEGRSGTRTYWRPAVDHRVSALPLERSVDHSLDVARETFRTHLGGAEHWADLTGGYDSRLLCLLLESAGVSFAANTRSAPTPDDVDIAGEVAARKGWPWRDACLPPTWPLLLPDVLPTALAWGDSQLEILQLSRVLHVHRELARSRRSLLSGGGGEHFQYYAWQPEYFAAGRSTRVHLDRWIDMIALKPADTSVLSGTPRAAVQDDYHARLSQWLEPYADELNTTQLERVYAYKSTGHFGAYRSADGAFLRAELPFYFKPIVSAAVSMSYRHRKRHLLMRHMIDRLDPGVARIRTTRGGPATPARPSTAHRYLPYYEVVGRKAVNKVSAAVLGSPLLLQRPGFPWEPAAHAAALTRLAPDAVLDWSSMRIASLLDRDRLETMIAASLRPGFGSSAMLGRILTAELALRATDTSLDDGAGQ